MSFSEEQKQRARERRAKLLAAGDTKLSVSASRRRSVVEAEAIAAEARVSAERGATRSRSRSVDHGSPPGAGERRPSLDGSLATARLSLEAQFPIFQVDPLGAGSTKDLHGAAELGNLTMVSRHLESAGAGGANAVDADGRTALHLAAGAGHAAVVARLLEAYASPDGTDAVGRSAVHWAARGGHADALGLLLGNLRRRGGGALEAAANAPDADGLTPLFLAKGSGEVSRLLLAAGARVAGSTPSLRAAAGGVAHALGAISQMERQAREAKAGTAAAALSLRKLAIGGPAGDEGEESPRSPLALRLSPPSEAPAE